MTAEHFIKETSNGNNSIYQHSFQFPELFPCRIHGSYNGEKPLLFQSQKEMNIS